MNIEQSTVAVESPAVSVIVPVYKAEKYLHKCVDSLLAQTFTDFEVLLVDDGSPDRSGAICDEYASQDPRVRVIHKANGGVSSARQCGLDNARGEYVIHADPDDWVEPMMLAQLYSKAKATSADMVICDYYVNRGGTQHYIKQQPDGLTHEEVLHNLFQQLHGSCCNKLVRRVCYTKADAAFPMDMNICEDLYVIVKLLSLDLRITYIPHAYYHYVQDANMSSLTSAHSSTFKDDLFIMNRFISMISYDKVAVNLCRNKMSFEIVAKAYDRKDFSSLAFARQCFPFRKKILRKRGIGVYYRLKLYLSCIGFYRFMLIVDSLKQRR